MDSLDARLVDVLVTTAAPLVAIDRAELYLVSASNDAVHVHLAGSYSGFPGIAYVERHLLAPLVAQVFPKARLRVTSGYPFPEGAQRIEPMPH